MYRMKNFIFKGIYWLIFLRMQYLKLNYDMFYRLFEFMLILRGKLKFFEGWVWVVNFCGGGAERLDFGVLPVK